MKDLQASKAFYEKFGFTVFGGDESQNWLILKNASTLETFTDVREIQRKQKSQGVTLQNEADEATTGPASFIAVDPDENPILVDQHV